MFKRREKKKKKKTKTKDQQQHPQSGESVNNKAIFAYDRPTAMQYSHFIGPPPQQQAASFNGFNDELWYHKRLQLSADQRQRHQHQSLLPVMIDDEEDHQHPAYGSRSLRSFRGGHGVAHVSDEAEPDDDDDDDGGFRSSAAASRNLIDDTNRQVLHQYNFDGGGGGGTGHNCDVADPASMFNLSQFHTGNLSANRHHQVTSNQSRADLNAARLRNYASFLANSNTSNRHQSDLNQPNSLALSEVYHQPHQHHFYAGQQQQQQPIRHHQTSLYDLHNQYNLTARTTPRYHFDEPKTIHHHLVGGPNQANNNRQQSIHHQFSNDNCSSNGTDSSTSAATKQLTDSTYKSMSNESGSSAALITVLNTKLSKTHKNKATNSNNKKMQATNRLASDQYLTPHHQRSKSQYHSSSKKSSVNSRMAETSQTAMVRSSTKQPLEISCFGRMAKFLLFLANLVFWCSGLALGAWGILSLVEDHKYSLSQLLVFEGSSRMSLLQLLSWSFITLGCAAVLVGVCGCSATVKNNRWILGLYIFLILAIFALDLATGLLAMIFQERLVTNVRLRLVQKLHSDYGVQASFTAAMDYCCGLEGHFDYDQSLWRLQRLGGFDATVARTCCHLRNTFDDQAHINPRPVNESMCQSSDVRFHQSYRYRKGCLDDLERLIRHKIWTYTIACGAVGAIIIMCLIFATCFCRSIPSGSKRTQQANSGGHLITNHQQPPDKKLKTSLSSMALANQYHSNPQARHHR